MSAIVSIHDPKAGHKFMEQSNIKDLVLSVREVASWSELSACVERALDASSALPCWEYATYACRACGGEPRSALPGAAAIFCLLQGIHLADDLLDEDPDGVHHLLGVGAAANMALALQAAASQVVEDHVSDPAVRARIHPHLIRAALATSFGQYLDTSDHEPDEEAYWRLADAKTPPLFEAALATGALLAGADDETAEGCRSLGLLMGRLAQVGDDLRDAMETPANPDWRSRRNNLALVFALCADYPEKERFLSAIQRIEDPQELSLAQEILIRSGAAAYCTYRMLEMVREIREKVAGLRLVEGRLFDEILHRQIDPLDELLQSLGAPPVEELLGAEA